MKPKMLMTGTVLRHSLRYLGSGMAFLKWSFAYNVWSKKQREGYEPAYSGDGFTATTWHSFVMFGDLAEKIGGWMDDKMVVTVEYKPNGDCESGVMRPKIYNGKTSYDWMAIDVTPCGDIKPTEKKVIIKNEPEEKEIPF